MMKGPAKEASGLCWLEPTMYKKRGQVSTFDSAAKPPVAWDR